MLCNNEIFTRKFGLSQDELAYIVDATKEFSKEGITLRLEQIEYLLTINAIKNIKEVKELILQYPQYLCCQCHVLHENEDCVVINKPFDVRIDHRKLPNGEERHYWPTETTVSDWFRKRYSQCSRVWLCHQLDYATSGILIIAKSQTAAATIGKYFQNREIKKHYVALVVGHVSPQWNHQYIDFALSEDEEDHNNFKMKISNDPKAKKCRTYIEIVEHGVLRSLSTHNNPFYVTKLCLQPITGRRHQLRLLASQVLRHPIVGDSTYGDTSLFYRLYVSWRAKCLHAEKLLFPKEAALPHLECPASFFCFDDYTSLTE